MEKNREAIELIKEKIDILSLVEKYVKLKPAGKNFVGLCPFHSEKTPSFNVSPDIGIFKCFGCGKSGDIFEFLQSIENIEFSEALKRLAKDAGVTLDVKNNDDSPILQINKWANLNYQKELLKNENNFALEYLIKRGINKEMIKTFEIGYATGDGGFLKRLNTYQSFSKKILLESGLFIEKEGFLKEKFKKRILFPIHSIYGKVIAFTGRLLPGNEYGPKYLNTAETPLFKKRLSLYGIYQAKSYIRKEDLCIILEGTTDVISLHNLNIKNTVAPLGTGLTSEQLELISRYTKNILFIFDSDIAGQNALERSFSLTSKLNLNSYAINTKPYKDIDEMAQKEPSEILKRIENKTDTFSYLVSNKVESLDLTKLNSSIKLNQYIAYLLNEVKDKETLDFFKQKAKAIVGKDIEFEIKNSNTDFSKEVVNKASNQDHVEDSLLAYIIRNGSENLPSEYTSDIFTNPRNQTIAKYIEKNKSTTPQELLSLASKSPDFKDWIERLLLKETENLEVEKLFKRIYTVYLNMQLKELRIHLAAAEEKSESQQIAKILSQVQEITDKLKTSKHENK